MEEKRGGILLHVVQTIKDGGLRTEAWWGKSREMGEKFERKRKKQKGNEITHGRKRELRTGSFSLALCRKKGQPLMASTHREGAKYRQLERTPKEKGSRQKRRFRRERE